MHSLSAWAPFLPFPSFYSFPWQTHTCAILHLSHYTNGPQQVFSPNPAPSCCPTPAGWISHKRCQSVPCLEDEICCISVAFSPAKWGSNVPKPFCQPWFPSSVCDVLPSVTQGTWGGLEDTIWGFLSSRSCLGPCSPSVFMWHCVLALTCIFSYDCVIPPTLVMLPFIFFYIRDQHCLGTPGKS